jgi:quercetin dioxygenase-like cupin family protein
MRRSAWCIGLAVALAATLAGLGAVNTAAATPPVGETFIPLAAGRVDEGVKAKSVTGSWRMRIQTNHSTDTLTAQVVHPPGSSSGWHKHAGPVMVTVVEGTLSFYFGDDPTCSPMLVHAGQTVVEQGGARAPAHYAVNEGSQDVKLLVTMFAPAGVSPRIDVPAPGNCPF